MVSRKLVVRGAIVAAVGLAVFLITPYAFWDGGGADYEFTADDVRPYVEGDWVVELAAADGAAAETLRVSMAWSHKAVRPLGASRGWIRSAAACGNRSLIRPAHACMDLTELALDVVVNGTPVPVPGTFTVYGKRFGGGQVAFRHDGRDFSAGLDAQGAITGASFGTRVGTMRRAP